LLKPTEFQVFNRIDGSKAPDQIAVPENTDGPRASRQAVIKFLGKLDALGLLVRGGGAPGPVRAARELYPRFSLFNPDRFLSWLDSKIGWMIGRPFIAGSFVMMAVAALGMLIRGTEAAAYTSYTYEAYGLAIILLFTLIITTLHEFAHGLACKHFGGEVPEVGVLMIFYVLPALYCNVSDIHRFGRKRERVWVIAAGIYWQLLVATAGALVWLVATPQTVLADFSFLVFLGATFNILINCNPLIKLDGYYALSQMIGIQNLQSRSSEYVRSVIWRIIDGDRSRAGDNHRDRGAPAEKATAGHERTGVSATRQPRAIYLLYWVLSIAYSIALVWLIVARVGDVLMDWLGVIGALLTLGLAFLVGQRFFRPVVRALGDWGAGEVHRVFPAFPRDAAMGAGLQWAATGATTGTGMAHRPTNASGTGNGAASVLGTGDGAADLMPQALDARPYRAIHQHKAIDRHKAIHWFQRAAISRRQVGRDATMQDAIIHNDATMQGIEAEQIRSGNATVEYGKTRVRARYSRRTIVKAAVAVMLIAIIVAPWEASAGSDCTLLLPPGHEAPVRAAVDATLAEVFVVPGDTVAEGARIARMANPELEDRLTQLNGEISRLDNRNSEIEETLRVRSEELLSASFKEQDRARLAAELKDEAAQIERARTAGGPTSGSAADAAKPATPADQGKGATPGALPATLAVLQSDIELKQTQLDYNRKEVERYRKLYEQGLVGSIQYDAAVNAVRMNEKELQQARARLDAALVDHHRMVNSTETSQLVAQTEARAARSNFQALIAELHANREQLESLHTRRQILQREYDSMAILAPRAGIVLGEDLRKTIGGRFNRGQEICRIGELERFLLQIDVNERDIADVKLESPVRFKLKTVPGRTFTGRVSKIRAESAGNPYGQRVYPVEVSVENTDGLLRPGMTGFARISFGRQPIGMIAVQKVWQALRPETWLF
jgi:multidrug efflux pump subunit AcrA (membrane-fusion protein)